jgi:hypothetical protein
VRRPWILLLSAQPLFCQVVVNPSALPPGFASFDRAAGEKKISCEVVPIRPVLDFNFRFQSGYVLRIPMGQYTGSGHRWTSIARVTPEGGTPVYLAGRVTLPDIPPTRVLWETGGYYLLGEGRYRVSWKMVDDSGRVCRKDWDIRAELRRGEREVKMAIPPGRVTDLALRGLPPVRLRDDAAPLRLTFLLHVAPLSPRRTRLGARDRFLLLSALSSVLQRVPARFVRLVVFNLEQQKEIYRRENFTLRGMGDVLRAMERVQLETVDYGVLRNRTGHIDLITDLLNREISAAPPSDAVIFLGPEARFSDKVPRQALEISGTGAPGFIYLQYRFPFGTQAAFPDSISKAVGGLKGKTLIIRTPGDLAKAIDLIERK